MKRRGFLGLILGAAVAPAALAEQPKVKWTYCGTSRGRWMSWGPSASNLPRYGGKLHENMVQTASQEVYAQQPSLTLDGDIDTDWYYDENGGLRITSQPSSRYTK